MLSFLVGGCFLVDRQRLRLLEHNEGLLLQISLLNNILFFEANTLVAAAATSVKLDPEVD